MGNGTEEMLIKGNGKRCSVTSQGGSALCKSKAGNLQNLMQINSVKYLDDCFCKKLIIIHCNITHIENDLHQWESALRLSVLVPTSTNF